MKFLKLLFFNIVKYLFAFMLVLLTSVLLYETARKNVEHSFLERTKLQIQAGVLTIEENVNKLDLTAQTMYENNNFTQLGWLTNESSAAEKIILLRNSNDLLKNTNALTDSSIYTFVLFRDNDLYLSTYQCNTFFPNYYNSSLRITLSGNSITDAATFKDLLLNHYKNRKHFLKLDYISYSDGFNQLEHENTLLYLADGIIDKRSSRKLFCFVLDRDYLVSNILTTEMQDHGFLSIQDLSSDEVIFSYGPIPKDFPQNPKENTWFSGVNTNFSTENDFYILQNINHRLGWKIVTGISRDAVAEQMAPAQRLLTTYLYAGAFVALGLAMFFSISKYYGFKKIIQAIPQEELIPSTSKFYTDYQLISHNILNLDEKKETYKLKMNKLKQQNQAILLENLITRDEFTGEEYEIFKELFPKEPEFYCVVLVRFLHHLSLKNNDAISIEMADYLQQKGIHVIHNVRSGIYDELFLLELSDNQESNTTFLLEPFWEMAEMITSKYNCFMHIGISTVGTNLSNITRCYTQAKQVVQTQHLYNGENVVQLYNIMEHSLNENPVTIDFLTRFYNMLICVRYHDLERELHQLESNCMRMPWLYEAHKEEIFFSLKNVFHSAIIHLNCEGGEYHLPVYTSTISCQETMQAFRGCAAWICNYVLSIKNNKQIDLQKRILEILEAEYPDPNLSAYTVSQKVGISEKYLYHFWKTHTGETFVASLFRIRIEKAQEYLVQTNYSNAKIAELTGFASVNTFYRNFQKQTGISPKKYQENIKQQNM